MKENAKELWTDPFVVEMVALHLRFLGCRPNSSMGNAHVGGGLAVTSSAFCQQLDAALKTEDGRAELKALFDSLDANQDGVISVQEWGDGVAKHKDVIAKFFGGATIEEIGRQFARIDANNDEKLSWDEMMAAAGITDA